MGREKEKIYEFEKFRLETADKTLWRENEKLPVPIKAVELLTLLVENRGRTVSKDEILETIWNETFVDENNLAVMVSTLRKAFGEGKNDNRFIETVPRRGYRFVHEIAEAGGDLIFEKRTVTEITVENGQSAALPQLQKQLKFQTAGLILLTVLLLGLAFLFFYNNRFGVASTGAADNPVKSVRPKQTLAVLPFKFIGDKTKDDEYISASLTETLTTRLGRLSDLYMRSSSATAEFAESPKSPTEIGRQLQVESILTGSFQRFGQKLRFNLHLLNVRDDAIVWSENFEEDSDDIFLLHDSLTAKIIDRLALELNDSQKTILSKKFTTDPEAEKLYIEGRVYWNERNVDGLKKSIEYFERAVQKDPNYALAFAGLADSFQLLAEYKGMSTNEAYSKARLNATRALELDPELAEAHNSLAYIQSFFDWDWERGEASFKRAIELNPNYATARHWYSELLNVRHRFDESWRELQTAHQLDPSSASIQGDIAHYYFIRRDYEKAIDEARKMVEKHPQFAYSYMYLYSGYEKLGREKEAAEALSKIHLYFGEDEKLVFERLKASESGGLKAYWQKALEQAQKNQIRLKPESIDYALGYMHVGNFDKTFEYLEKSLDERNRWFLEITYDPEWDPIRTDPRYDELLKKAGLKRLEN